MAEHLERRGKSRLHKQVEIEEEDEEDTSPSSDQSDATITAGAEISGLQSTGGSPESGSPEENKNHDQSGCEEKPNHITQAHQKLKPLTRSEALCDDTSPPPSEKMVLASMDYSSTNNKQQTPRRGKLEKNGSLSSEVSCLSRDSSMDTPYTDSTGIDLEEFIKKTLNKTAKDRKILLKLETDLKNFIHEPKHHYLKFPEMSSYERMLVHRVGAFYGLDHNVDQTGKCVIVNKTANTRDPEFVFQDYIQNYEIQPKKQILKRCGLSLDEKESSGFEKHLSLKNRTKSLEERQQKYDEARARIFRQQQEEAALALAASEEGHIVMSAKGTPSRPTSLSGSRENISTRLWSSTDSSGYGTDCSTKQKLSMTKASSFGGVSTHHISKPSYRAVSLSKTDSFSSASSSLGSPMARPPVIPSSPPGSQSGASPLSTSSSGHTHSPLPMGYAEGMSCISPSAFPAAVPSQGQQVVYVAAPHLEAIPSGGIILNPQTGQPYLNPDGSIYRRVPGQPLPVPVPSNVYQQQAQPVYPQAQFIPMDGRQYSSDSSGSGELCHQLSHMSLTPQSSMESIGEAPTLQQPGAGIVMGNQMQQSGCPPQQGGAYMPAQCPNVYYQSPGGQSVRYVYSMPYVNQHGGQSQSMVAVEGQGQAQSQVQVPPTSAFAQQFIAGGIPGSYQNPTYQATSVSEPTPAFTGSNYPAPGTTYPMPQTDSAISGYAPYNQANYGQSPAGPVYYTIPSSTGPPVTFSYGGTGQGSILRPATPPNQHQTGTGGAGGNQNLTINVAQPGTPNTNSSSAQYMPYTTYPGSRLPASPQMGPYSSGVPPQPAGQTTFPMLRPGVQVGIPVPCPGNLSHGQSPAGIQHVQSAVSMKGVDLRLGKQPGEYVMDGGGGLKDITIPAGLALNQQMQAVQPHLAATARSGNTNLFRSSVQSAGSDIRLVKPSGYHSSMHPVQLPGPHRPRVPVPHGVGGSTSHQKVRKTACKSNSRELSAIGDGEPAGTTGCNVLEVYDLPPTMKRAEADKLLKDLTSQGARLHYVLHDSSRGTDIANSTVSDYKNILAIFTDGQLALQALNSTSQSNYKTRSTTTSPATTEPSAEMSG